MQIIDVRENTLVLANGKRRICMVYSDAKNPLKNKCTGKNEE